MGINAIDAIRQSQDIRVEAKNVTKYTKEKYQEKGKYVDYSVLENPEAEI